MHRTEAGFTLIELMIVIAIIGILAMIAIPAYEDYSTQAQIAEGTTLASNVETAFTENYDESGIAANTNASLQIVAPISGHYVSSVALSAPGQVTVKYGGIASSYISGGTIVWTAYESPHGDITWVCNNGAATARDISGPPAMNPVGASAINGTLSTASGKGPYLPPICQ